MRTKGRYKRRPRTPRHIWNVLVLRDLSRVYKMGSWNTVLNSIVIR